MKQTEKLSRRQTLQGCLGVLGVSLTEKLPNVASSKPSTDFFNIDEQDSGFETFVFDEVIPRPKHRLYDTVKASTTVFNSEHDEMYYLGVIVGLWWQPEHWRVFVGWTYQVFVLSTNSPYYEPTPLMEFTESEIMTNF